MSDINTVRVVATHVLQARDKLTGWEDAEAQRALRAINESLEHLDLLGQSLKREEGPSEVEEAL